MIDVDPTPDQRTFAEEFGEAMHTAAQHQFRILMIALWTSVAVAIIVFTAIVQFLPD